MSKTFFISDTHFGHTNICNFTNYDGSPLRPWDIIEEHDAALIENWNRVVPNVSIELCGLTTTRVFSIA
jgi:calcineurin-like phosphoesterase family protein